MSNTEDRERWQKIKNVLAVALELPPIQRPAFLEESCGKDLQLRREVESLLAFELAEDARTETSASTEIELYRPPERIGAYKIIKEVGHGGMGTVYEGERADDAYQKRVAIKVIRIDTADSENILQRFRNERQILASLEHPNISRLLDGVLQKQGCHFW